MATSPLPFAAVELVDPVGHVGNELPGPGEPEGPGEGRETGKDGHSGGVSGRRREGPALALRAVGSERYVKAVEARVRKRVFQEGPPWKDDDLIRLEGRESIAFHEGLGAWEEEGDLVLRDGHIHPSAVLGLPALAAHHEEGENPCANPCAENPCGENPCGENPCGDNPCEENPCGE